MATSRAKRYRKSGSKGMGTQTEQAPVEAEIGPKPVYKWVTGDPYLFNRYSKQEMRTFARDLHAGNIFTSHNVPVTDIPHVFLPIAFLGKRGLDQFVMQGNAVLWEYLYKAGPRSVNGNPQFFGCRMFTWLEWEFVYGHICKIQETMDALESED